MEQKVPNLNKVIGFTLLLILFGAGLLASALILVFGGWNLIVIVSVVICGVGSILALLKLQRSQTERRMIIRKQLLDGMEQADASWEVKGKDWSDYLAKMKADLSEKRKALPFQVGIAVFGVTLYFIYQEYDYSWLYNGAISLLLAVTVALTVWLIFASFMSAKMKLLTSKSDGLVILTKAHILINDFVIECSGLKRYVSRIKLDEQFIHMEISAKIGNRFTHEQYYIPVPTDKLEEAESLVCTYEVEAALFKEKSDWTELMDVD